MSRNIGKNISKNLSSIHSQKHFNHAKQSTTDALKTISKRAIQKTPEATSDLIENKIADKITRVSKAFSQNNSEKILNMIEKYIEKDKYIQNIDRKLLMI